MSDWILPRADAACGKVFHPDRKSAEGYRIALEFWDQATGRFREDYRLISYRCKRCGGFHLARRRLKRHLAPMTPCDLTAELQHEHEQPGYPIEVDIRDMDSTRASNGWLMSKV
jgi:hypothetical protein